ncbi:hypothetical protein TNIN_26351 [Trichonephila inaurata madagascariensis]|uniref:Uncharacterized protein n=1 Tax=Trichonephila inaurata madagascariensis TaxID=2747483 RepID=A0A8X6J419_9ARAC|nr:hypothetical protein TNIN_26351 [Trichonephila inaurata madagascariensis]
MLGEVFHERASTLGVVVEGQLFDLPLCGFPMAQEANAVESQDHFFFLAGDAPKPVGAATARVLPAPVKHSAMRQKVPSRVVITHMYHLRSGFVASSRFRDAIAVLKSQKFILVYVFGLILVVRVFSVGVVTRLVTGRLPQKKKEAKQSDDSWPLHCHRWGRLDGELKL